MIKIHEIEKKGEKKIKKEKNWILWTILKNGQTWIKDKKMDKNYKKKCTKLKNWKKKKNLNFMDNFEKCAKLNGLPPPVRGTLSNIPCLSNLRPGAMILGKPPLRLFWMSTIFMLFSCSRSCSLMCQATCSICSRASFKLVLSGWESGVFLITSSNNNLYLE